MSHYMAMKPLRLLASVTSNNLRLTASLQHINQERSLHSSRQGKADSEPKKKSTTGDYRAVDLAYESFERKLKEGERVKNPLVILHSLLGSKKNWKTVAKEVTHLTHRKVVSVDHRNHGESPHTKEMSYSLLAKDMNRLFKQLKIERMDFMGHTMGGRVGMVLALTQPQLINKLVCVDATPVNSTVSLDRWATLAACCQLLKDMEKELRAQQGVQRVLLADKAIRPILPNQYDRSLFLTNLLTTTHQQPKSDASNSQPRLWRLNIDAIIDNPEMPASFPQFRDVQFKGKTLFIAGDHSKFLKKEHYDDIYRLFPNAKIHIVKDCGHWVHSDKHREFMEIVVPFLET